MARKRFASPIVSGPSGTILLAAIFVIGLSSAAGSPVIAQRSIVDSLLGTWVLDDTSSDDLEQKLGELSALRPGGGFGWNSPRSGTYPGRGARGPGSRVGSKEQEELERRTRAADVLRLERLGEALEILDGNRDTRLVFPDGRQLIDGLGGQSAAFVEGAKLVIETRVQQRQSIETVTLEGDRMRWQTTIQGGRTPELTYSLVYDRVAQRETTARPEPETIPLPEVAPEVAELKRAPDSEDASSDGLEDGRDKGTPRSSVDSAVPGRAGEGVAPREENPDEGSHIASVIRLLPPRKRANQLLTGGVLMQTLTIDPQIATVEFYLDDERVARRPLPPFEAKIKLADPPRQQVVEVRALGLGDQVLGTDRIVLNRLDPVFRVQIREIDKTAKVARVRALVSVPRKAELDRVEVFLGEQPVESRSDIELDPVRHEAEIEVSLATAASGANDYVKVVAHLADGRQLEDVELLQAGAFSEELDVQLIQLQVLVTDKAGNPVTDLTAEDFEVRDGGVERQVERLYPSRDLALVLGMAIDSSGSMGPIWPQTREAAQRFLEGTLATRDRAFLVDFDTQLRLLQSLTGDKAVLERSLGRLYPEGGTALYDSILFSLLQFEHEPGRRALIVFTDGFDSESRADPQRAIEFGKQLGVPVYVIAMDQRGGRVGGPGGPPPGAPGRSTGSFGAGPGSVERQLRNNLRLITDPTGGRLFQVSSVEQIERVFEQIQLELRSQYVLTYYTDQPPGTEIDPRVDVGQKGLRVRMAVQSE